MREIEKTIGVDKILGVEDEWDITTLQIIDMNFFIVINPWVTSMKNELVKFW